jgi:hypothetical protein
LDEHLLSRLIPDHFNWFSHSFYALGSVEFPQGWPQTVVISVVSGQFSLSLARDQPKLFEEGGLQLG